MMRVDSANCIGLTSSYLWRIHTGSWAAFAKWLRAQLLKNAVRIHADLMMKSSGFALRLQFERQCEYSISLSVNDDSVWYSFEVAGDQPCVGTAGLPLLSFWQASYAAAVASMSESTFGHQKWLWTLLFVDPMRRSLTSNLFSARSLAVSGRQPMLESQCYTAKGGCQIEFLTFIRWKLISFTSCISTVMEVSWERRSFFSQARDEPTCPVGTPYLQIGVHLLEVPLRSSHLARADDWACQCLVLFALTIMKIVVVAAKQRAPPCHACNLSTIIPYSGWCFVISVHSDVIVPQSTGGSILCPN